MRKKLSYLVCIIPQQWFVAGHVTCFTGGHAALGVFAMVVLILCALVIPISFILSVYQIDPEVCNSYLNFSTIISDIHILIDTENDLV